MLKVRVKQLITSSTKLVSRGEKIMLSSLVLTAVIVVQFKYPNLPTESFSV